MSMQIIKAVIRRLAIRSACALGIMAAWNSVEARSMWENISPEGGTICDLQIAPSNPSVLYAGVLRRGVYSSTDGAGRWRRVTAFPSMAWGSYAIAVSPRDFKTAWVAGDGRFVWKTGDGGGTWERTDLGVDVQTVYDLRVAPTDGSILYACGYRWVDALRHDLSYEAVVFGSDDGGRKWRILGSWPSDSMAVAIAVDTKDPEIAYLGVTEMGLHSTTSIYRTINAGRTWARSDTGIPAGTAITDIQVDGRAGRLYASAVEKIYVSEDGARSWHPTSERPLNTHAWRIAVDPLDSNILYLASKAGVLVSRDSGATWSRLGNGGSDEVDCVRVQATISGRIFYAGTPSDGIQRLVSGVGEWASSNGGLDGALVSTAAFLPGSLDRILAGGDGFVWKSTNGGRAWTSALRTYSWDSVSAIGVDPFSPDTIYASTFSLFWKSTDGGKSWQVAEGSGIPPTWSESILFTPTQLYAVGMFELNRSPDGGESWPLQGPMGSFVRMGKPYYDLLGGLAVVPGNPDRLYGAKYGLGVLQRIGDGDKWRHLNQGLGNKDVNDLVLDPHDPSTLYAATYSGIYKTTNDGGTWRATGLDHYDVITIAVDQRQPNVLYAGTYKGYPYAGGVFRSADGGLTWESINDGLGELNIYRLVADPSGGADVLAITFEGSLYRLIDR